MGLHNYKAIFDLLLNYGINTWHSVHTKFNSNAFVAYFKSKCSWFNQYSGPLVKGFVTSMCATIERYLDKTVGLTG